MGVRVSRTLNDDYITCQESHYPGVLDNPQPKDHNLPGFVSKWFQKFPLILDYFSQGLNKW